MRTISILAGTLICSACLKVGTAEAETPVIPPKTPLELAAEAMVGETPSKQPATPPVVPAAVAPPSILPPSALPVAPSAPPSGGRGNPSSSRATRISWRTSNTGVFNFFGDTANPQTGLVPDRVNADGGAPNAVVSSIASDGFGLTALCIGVEHGWIDKASAYSRALITLRFFDTHLSNEQRIFFFPLRRYEHGRAGVA